MKRKLYLAMGSIASILLLSSVISILEYRRMSNYVSDLIANNIYCINVAHSLSESSNEYNHAVLSIIGDSLVRQEPRANFSDIQIKCDTLKASIPDNTPFESAVDSVYMAYKKYVDTSRGLKEVVASEFVDARTWYFEVLQPEYQHLRVEIDELNTLIHEDLKRNSEDFQAGFYRSIIPGVVSVAAGLLLVILLFYFIMTLYVRPLYRISDGLDAYRQSGRKHTYTFDGDDQLANINSGVSEIIDENIELKHRVKNLREERNSSL